MKRIAAISDIHGCYEELEELYNRLSWISLDEIWHLGDVVDRGPHSGKTVEFCRKNNIKGVMGNHEDSILKHIDRMSRGGNDPRNPDKLRTISELSKEDIEYIKLLPPLHVIDDLNLVLVHGGLWPTLPLHKQPYNVCRAQMVHPFQEGKSSWWGPDSLLGPQKKSEDELHKLGWRRWYQVYDHSQDVIYGHSTWAQPMIYQNAGYGKSIGIDTGSCFGGSVTACVYESSGSFCFVSVKCKKLYFKAAHRSYWEE